MVTCAFCGKRASSAPAVEPERDPRELPLTWATSVENGKVRVYCDVCAREHVRSIESKLDSEWW